jgi:hypothetical protein
MEEGPEEERENEDIISKHPSREEEAEQAETNPVSENDRDAEREDMETEQQDQMETNKSDAYQLDTEDIEKAEALQTELENRNKLNAPSIETEDSFSSNPSACIRAEEINIDPPTPRYVKLTTRQPKQNTNISQLQGTLTKG